MNSWGRRLSQESGREKLVDRGLGAALFLLALALRVPHLASRSLWLDETWRVAFAEAPLVSLRAHPAEFFGQIASYTGLLRMVLGLFGHSEYSVRIVSALAGSLAIPAAYRLGRLAMGPLGAASAALLLCCSPLHITYSQEGAEYALESLLAIVLLLALAGLDRQPSRRRLAGAGGVAGAMILLHVYAAVIVGLAFFAHRRTREISRKALWGLPGVCLAGVGALLLWNYLPWFATAQIQIRPIDAWITSYPVRMMNGIAAGPWSGGQGPIFRGDLFAPAPVAGSSWFFHWLAWGSIGTAIFSAGHAFRLAARNRAVGIWLAIASLYFAFLALQSLWTYQAHLRYFVPMLGPVYLLWATVGEHPRRTWARWLARAGLACVLLNFALILREDPPGKRWKPDVRGLAAEVDRTARERPGVVLIVPRITELPIYEFYLAKSPCAVLRPPAYGDYFFKNQRSMLFMTPAETAAEERWFADKIRSGIGGISTVFIASQIGTAQASEILEMITPLFRRVTTHRIDHVLFIKLER